MQPDVLYDLALRELVEDDDPIRDRIREAEEVQGVEDDAPDGDGEE